MVKEWVRGPGILHQRDQHTSLICFLKGPEMPEITEMMENFTEVAKYFSKLESLINYIWEKSHT